MPREKVTQTLVSSFMAVTNKIVLNEKLNVDKKFLALSISQEKINNNTVIYLLLSTKHWNGISIPI